MKKRKVKKYSLGGMLGGPDDPTLLKPKPYKPSNSVLDTKGALAGLSLAGNVFMPAVGYAAQLLNVGGDLYTGTRYAMDGQYKDAAIDYAQALVGLIPSSRTIKPISTTDKIRVIDNTKANWLNTILDLSDLSNTPNNYDMKKKQTKKYATGTGDLGMLLGKAGLSSILSMTTNAIGELGYSLGNPEPSPIAVQNPTTPIMKYGGKMSNLRKYLFGSEANAEVEGGEAYETPEGEVGQFEGASHENGGIDINAPEGTKIYSDRLSKDGKSMADRKLARDRQENKLMAMLSRRPGDSISKRTFDRKTQYLEKQEALDLKIQELAQMADEAENLKNSPKEMKEQFAWGTPPDGLTGEGIFGKMKQYNIYEGEQKPNVYDEKLWETKIPQVSEFENLIPFISDTKTATDSYDKSLNSISGSPSNNFDLTFNNKINSSPKKEMNPLSFGNELGLLGNAVGATAPLTTTLLNRLQDKNHDNYFNSYGQQSLADNDKLMQNLQANRDVNLRDIDLQSSTTNQSITDGSRSSAVKRSSQLALNSNTNLAKSKARANYAQQLASVFGQRQQLNLNIDQTRSKGAEEADLLNRADTDAFFTNLNKDFNNIATILQKTGKDFNDKAYNEKALTLINQTGLYGQYFDKDGKLKPGLDASALIKEAAPYLKKLEENNRNNNIKTN